VKTEKPKGKDEELRMPADEFDRIMGQVLGSEPPKPLESAPSALQDPACFCVDTVPATKPPCPTCRSTGWIMLQGLRCNMCPAELAQPAPDGLTEREREAWEIHNAGLMAGYGLTPISWLAMEESQRRRALASRDKAAEIFAEKARAGLQQAMDAAGAELFQARRVRDDCRASHDKAMAMLKEAQTERHCLLQQEYGKKVFENERLTARNAELAKALREACGRSPGGDPAISDNERPIVCTCCKIHGKASAK
jgi:hypothetical protein